MSVMRRAVLSGVGQGLKLPDVLRLYLVTDQASLGGRPLTDVVLAAVHGGVSCVQLREKNLPTRDFVAQACALQALLTPLGVPLVINDRIDVALACGAQGVHLPVGHAGGTGSADVATGRVYWPVGREC